jgi:hypothetical protein
MPAARTTKADVGFRTLEVTTRTDTFRITIPADAKVTYAPIVSPGGRGGSDFEDRGTAVLRIYEGADKQRAMFRNVISFRDLSYALQKKVQRVDESTSFRSDEEGEASERQLAVEEAWVSVD